MALGKSSRYMRLVVIAASFDQIDRLSRTFLASWWMEILTIAILSLLVGSSSLVAYRLTPKKEASQ